MERCDPLAVLTTGNLEKFSVFIPKFSVSENIGTRELRKLSKKNWRGASEGAATPSVAGDPIRCPPAEQLLFAQAVCSLVSKPPCHELFLRNARPGGRPSH